MGEREREREISPNCCFIPQRVVMARTALRPGPRASSQSYTIHVGSQTIGLFLVVWFFLSYFLNFYFFLLLLSSLYNTVP